MIFRPLAWRTWLLDLALLGVAVAAIIIAATWLARPTLTIQAADADARRYLGAFWAKEQNATDTYRWAQPDAQLRLFGFEQRGPLLVRVRLSASRPANQPLVQLTLTNIEPALRFTLGREWREYTLLLPAPPHDAEGRLLALHSLVDPPYAESRPLGFALSSISVVAHPLTPADRLPDGGRLAFLVLLAATIYGALRRRLARRPAFALVLAGALALGAWMLVAPIAAGYWLPNLWLALALAWLALLAPLLLRAVHPRLPAGLAVGAGLLALGLAQALLPLQQGWLGVLGWPLLLLGGMLLAAALPSVPPAAAQPVARRTVLAALALITLVALGLRLLGLDALPLGMWRDEARHGLLALRILHDPAYRPVYVPGMADLPAGLFYLVAPAIGLFGPEPWAVRLMPALCGALTPLALYWAARPLFGARAALLSAALLALSVWHITLSRFAFPTVIGPLLTLVALGCLWRLCRAERVGARLLAALGMGLAVGITVYAYHTSRLTPLVLALLTCLWLGRDWRAWRRVLPFLALAAVLALALAAPLIRYAWDNQAGFSKRIGQTSIFNPDSLEIRAPLARIEQNLGLHLGMWNARGDYIGRHNLPNAPMLDPLTGVLFAVGVALVLAGWRDRRARLLGAWVLLALAAGLFSIEAPHAMRTVESLAPSIVLAGLGSDAVLGWAATGGRRTWVRAGVAVVLLAVLLLNGLRYFVAWPARNQVYEQFYVADTHIGLLAQRLARDPLLAAGGYRLFIPSGPGDASVLNYLSFGLAVEHYDGQSLTVPPGDRAILIAYGELPPGDVERAAVALGPAAQQLGLGPRSPLTGQPEYVVFGVGDVARAAVQRALDPAR